MTDDDIASARTYGGAYAAFDADPWRGVLARDLQFRHVNPGSHFAVSSTEAYIEATADFLRNFTAPTPPAARAEQIVFENSAHFMWLEEPDRFFPLVAEWPSTP